MNLRIKTNVHLWTDLATVNVHYMRFYGFRNPNDKDKQDASLPISKERNRFRSIVWEEYDPVHQKYLEIGQYLHIYEYLNVRRKARTFVIEGIHLSYAMHTSMIWIVNHFNRNLYILLLMYFPLVAYNLILKFTSCTIIYQLFL